MKYLILFSALTALSVQAQNFSPSASGIGTQGAGTSLNQTSPSSIGGTTAIPGNTNPSATIQNNPSTTLGGPTTIGGQPVPFGQGTGQTIDQTNTAPTPITNDTSLINTPSNDPLIQSQEETGTGTFPAPATDNGSGTLDSGTNSQVPFTP